MNYSRQEFVDEKTVLKAEMLDHMEEGIVNNEKDNFLFTYGQNISNNLYKKEALRVSSNDLIEALLLDKAYLKVSNKAPSLEDFYNGFTIGYDIPFKFFEDDDSFDDWYTECLEHISSYYQKIGESLDESLGELYAELPLMTAETFPIKVPLVIDAPSPMAPEIISHIIEVDPDLPQLSILSFPGTGIESPFLLFVSEDLYDDGTLTFEKGTYAFSFLYHVGISLYISGFSFEEEKEEEQPIIQVYLGESLYWDGNTNGTITKTSSAKEDNIYMKIELCKLSNTFPTLEQLQKGYWGTTKLRTSEKGVSAETTESFNISQENFNKSVKFLEDGKAILLETFDEILGICIVFETCELNLDGLLFGQINPGFYGLKMHFSNDTSAIETRIETFSVQDFFNWTPTVVPKFQENLDVVYMSTEKNDKYIYRTSNTKDKTNRVTTEELYNKQLTKGKLPLISLLPLGMFSSIGVDINTKGIDEETGEPLAFYRLTILLPGEEKTTYLYTAEYPEE